MALSSTRGIKTSKSVPRGVVLIVIFSTLLGIIIECLQTLPDIFSFASAIGIDTSESLLIITSTLILLVPLGAGVWTLLTVLTKRTNILLSLAIYSGSSAVALVAWLILAAQPQVIHPYQSYLSKIQGDSTGYILGATTVLVSALVFYILKTTKNPSSPNEV